MVYIQKCWFLLDFLFTELLDNNAGCPRLTRFNVTAPILHVLFQTLFISFIGIMLIDAELRADQGLSYS